MTVRGRWFCMRLEGASFLKSYFWLGSYGSYKFSIVKLCYALSPCCEFCLIHCWFVNSRRLFLLSAYVTLCSCFLLFPSPLKLSFLCTLLLYKQVSALLKYLEIESSFGNSFCVFVLVRGGRLVRGCWSRYVEFIRWFCDGVGRGIRLRFSSCQL